MTHLGPTAVYSGVTCTLYGSSNLHAFVYITHTLECSIDFLFCLIAEQTFVSLIPIGVADRNNNSISLVFCTIKLAFIFFR